MEVAASSRDGESPYKFHGMLTLLHVRLQDETVWLTQGQMAQLFGKDKRTISEHIRNIFKEGELQEDVVVLNFRITTPHGAIPNKTQESNVNLYNRSA